MTASKIISILAYISTLYPDYKISDNPDNIVEIWKESLEGVDDKVIHNAIKEHYKESRWAPHLSDILKRVHVATEEALPEPSEIVAEIRKLASNSRQPMDDKPEYIREVVRLMGGLERIGQRQWDNWLEKEIAGVYAEWKNKEKYHYEKGKLTGLGNEQKALMNIKKI